MKCVAGFAERAAAVEVAVTRSAALAVLPDEECVQVIFGCYQPTLSQRVVNFCMHWALAFVIGPLGLQKTVLAGRECPAHCPQPLTVSRPDHGSIRSPPARLSYLQPLKFEMEVGLA